MAIASTDMSLEHRVALMTQDEQNQILAGVDMEELAYDWGWNGRPSQILPIRDDEPDSGFTVALALAGRGWGKSLAGSQWIRGLDAHWKDLGRDPAHLRIALLGRTAADVRDVMLEGPSGLLNIYPPSLRDRVFWIPSRRRVELPNGGTCTCFSAEEPAQLRGPQFHCFPAGTMVRGDAGSVPIESLRVGDRVWTRAGLRPVVDLQSSMSEVATLHHARGTLTGTLDHPVLTQRGWVDLALVHPTDTLVGWTSESGRSITEGELGEKKVTAAEGASGEAITTGRPLTGHSLPDSRSIISTLTGLMTSPATWSPSLTRTMSPFIWRPSSPDPVTDAARTLTSMLSAATESSASRARKSDVARRSARQMPIGAADILRLADTAEPSSSPEVEPIAVKGVSTSGRVTRVYNLTVQGQPEYFADDILVHNCGWADELATYKQIRTSDDDASAWDNLRIAVRLGNRPQILATTTPKRVPVLRQLLQEAVTAPGKFLIRRGKTYDNKYLSGAYLDVLVSLYGGTQLGRQELEGEMLDDVDGAMTSEAIINATRVRELPEGIPWIRLVSVDPSVAERPNDECGIVVIYISRTWPVLRRHAFIVDDLSVRASPTVWSDRVIAAAVEHDATIIAETNQGANLVFQMLRMAADKAGVPMPPMKEVWASKAKAVRAEPVGAAYARRRIHHVNVLADLETQLTTWTPSDAYSPDRMDALTQGCAAGLFPEALTSGGLGSTTLYNVSKEHISTVRQAAMVRASTWSGR